MEERKSPSRKSEVLLDISDQQKSPISQALILGAEYDDTEMKERKSLNRKSGVLLDLSDEQKIPFSQALILGAEYDDTFGLYNNNHVEVPVPVPAVNGSGVEDKGSEDGARHDENGNPLNTPFEYDMEIFDLDAVSQFPSYDSTIDYEYEGMADLRVALKDKIRVIKHLAWEAEQEMPNPVVMTGWGKEEGKERIRTLFAGAAEVMDMWNKIKDVKHDYDEPSFDIPLLDWTPAQIRETVNGRSRVDQIAAEICQILENPRPPTLSRPQPPLSLPSPFDNGVIEEGHSDETPGRVQVSPRADVTGTPGSAPPSPTAHSRDPVLLSKDTSLSLRSLESESTKPSLSGTLRRTQSCAGTSRQFIPPIAASSPRPMRADLNRSIASDSANSLQRQSSFKKTIATVRSSGYGQPKQMAPPSPGPRSSMSIPSPIRSTAGVRSRNSLSLIGSPQRDVTANPSRQLLRGSPARSVPSRPSTTSGAPISKANLDSTFTAAGRTQPRLMRPPSATVSSTATSSLAPPSDRFRNGIPSQRKSGLPVSRLPPPAPITTKEDIAKMLNKFGFRK